MLQPVSVHLITLTHGCLQLTLPLMFGIVEVLLFWYYSHKFSVKP